MNKQLNIAAGIFMVIAFIIMALTHMHFVSLCFAGLAFCCFGISISMLENKQKQTIRIKGMLFNNKSIVKY